PLRSGRRRPRARSAASDGAVVPASGLGQGSPCLLSRTNTSRPTQHGELMMRRHETRLVRHAFLIACLAAVPTLVWGCGGGSSSSSHVGPAAPAPNAIRMGAASSPKYHAVFDAMKRDFLRQGH